MTRRTRLYALGRWTPIFLSSSCLWAIQYFLSAGRGSTITPYILDLTLFATCSRHLKAEDDAEICSFPFQTWRNLLSCKDWPHLCRNNAGEESTALVSCADSQRTVRCQVGKDSGRATTADAILLSHIGLPHETVSNSTLREEMLNPAERKNKRQIWGLELLWESTVYYPAGASPEIRSYFNYSWGSAINVTDVKVSYPPKWWRFQRHINMTTKRDRARELQTTSSVVLLVSNCGSHSNREAILQQFMALLHVDSYGKCFNNKQMKSLQIDDNNSNFHSVVFSEEKIELLSAYKFQIIIENSIDPMYVSEKIMHAWEAGVVPVYLGAPDIDLFLPSERSFIDLRKHSVQDAVNLMKKLDSDDDLYLEYHKWRSLIPIRKVDPSKHLGSLGKILAASNKTNPYCAICKMIHRSPTLARTFSM